MIERDQERLHFVVVGDASHTAVVRSAVPAGMTNDQRTRGHWEQPALELARQRFFAHGVVPGGLQVKGIWDGESELDEFQELGLPEAGLIEAGMRLYNDDDLTVDANAVLSGLNIQIWQYMEPGTMMAHLAVSGPMRNVRSMPAMSDTSSQDAAIEALRRALVTCRTAFDQLANGAPFNVVVEQTGCLAAVIGALNDTQCYEGRLDHAQLHMETSPDSDDDVEGPRP